MEEPELEEGEAFDYKDDASIDPDIALSYIDEKLQNVLGHFQKDFEGGVSAENLGAKFGGYGSFLPTYQRSPHPKTPQRAQNYNSTPRSPNNLHVEGAPQNSTAPSDVPLSLKLGTGSSSMHSMHNPKVTFADVSTKKDSCLLSAQITIQGASQNATATSDVPLSLKLGTGSSSMHSVYNPKVAFDDVSGKKDSCLLSAQVAEKLPLKREPFLSKPVNPTDQRSLKVRIKVGSDNIRKNTAIYSGLGLISPSSSMGNSPEESGGMPFESRATPDESPASILQGMTLFPVPGGLLLSPLQESLLCLMRKENVSLDSKPAPPLKGRQRDCSMLQDDSASMLGDGKMSKWKKTKSVGKGETLEELKHGDGMNFEDNTASPLKKNMEADTLESKQCFSNDLKLKRLPNSIRNTGDSLKDVVRAPVAYTEAEKDVPVKKREVNKHWVKNRLASTGLVKEESSGLMYDRDGGKYEQQDASSSSMEKIREHRVRSYHQDVSVDPMEGGKSKGNRINAPFKANSDVSKCEKDSNTGAVDHIKQKVGPKVTLHKQDEIKIPHSTKTMPTNVKKKLKGSQSNGKMASDLAEESLRSGVRAAPKDRKRAQKDVHKVRCNYEDVLDLRSEQMANQMNPLERPSGDRAKDYNLEAVKEKEAPNDGPPSTKGLSSEMELASVAPAFIAEDWVCCDHCQTWRLLPYGMKPEQLPENWLCSMLTWLPGMNRCDISEDETTKALRALYQLPLLESQNNVQNHTDRTAPEGTSVDVPHFNQNHQELNSNAMPNRGKKQHKSKRTSKTASNCGPVQTSNFTKNSRQEVVKSRSLNDMNQPVLETNMMNKSNAQHPSKSCNFAAEMYGDKQNEKLVNGGAFKQKKLKSKRESDQYGYDTTKKIKSEAALGTDKYWTSEHGGDLGRVSLSSSTGLPTRESGKDMQKYGEHCYSKDAKFEQKDRLLISVKKQEDCTQVSLDGGSLDMRTCDERELYVKKRKLKDWQDSQNYLETLRSNGDHLLDNKGSLNEEKSENEIKQQKKSRVPRTKEESSAIKGDDRSNTEGVVTRILLSGSRDNPVDRSVKKDQQPRKYRVKVASQLTMDDVVSLKKDLGSEQFSMAATSSSSKVSDSRKRASFQEVKGSPVESVSSSPMRTSNTYKLSPTRRGISGKDDSKNDDFPLMGSPRKSLEGEGNFKSNQSGTSRKEDASGFLHPESFGPVLDFCDSDARHKFGVKAESSIKPSSEFEKNHLINIDAGTLTQHHPCFTDVHASGHRHSEDRMSTKPYRNTVTLPRKSGKGSSLRSKDKDRSSGNNFQRVTVKISDPSREQELNPKKISRDEAQIDHHQLVPHHEELIGVKHHFSDECSFKSSKDDRVGKKGSRKCATDSRRENLTKFREHNGSNAELGGLCSVDGKVTLQQKPIQDFEGEIAKKKDSTQIESRGGKSQVSSHHAGKKDAQSCVRQPISGSLKGSGFDVRPVGASGDGDVLKVLKQPGNVVHQNGAHNIGGNPVPKRCVVRDLCGSSPVKRDASSETATSTLKEAEELRDCADRLKNTGFDFECNEAYFQAALKFLHGASLLETCNSSSSKHGEMTQMQTYTSTAKLCETCAHEYEKRQEMAAAALAYKCMEVAYMRVVYCKSSSTSRDRHDLQASLQIVPQGESPSSSASDVDNLNNQATLDKAALSRGMNSHAGTHVIVARNRPNFVRLLDFTSDVNSAMEASRKSQNAFEAASVILEETQNKEGIVSLKRVIDFSFQDIEELVRLVRVASEAINRQGFSGNRD